MQLSEQVKTGASIYTHTNLHWQVESCNFKNLYYRDSIS